MEQYVTVTGFKQLYNLKPFGIGNIFYCAKEPKNQYDSDAIQVLLPLLGKVGYIANSVETIAGGTLSAGRIYEKMDDIFYIKVCFTTYTKVICQILDDPEQAKRDLEAQMSRQMR